VLIESYPQLGNLPRDFPVKHVSVLRSQPCAYRAYQRCHVSQLASHGDQLKIVCRVPGMDFGPCSDQGALVTKVTPTILSANRLLPHATNS
jgi:hypothetical protein